MAQLCKVCGEIDPRHRADCGLSRTVAPGGTQGEITRLTTEVKRLTSLLQELLPPCRTVLAAHDAVAKWGMMYWDEADVEDLRRALAKVPDEFDYQI